MVFMKRSFYDKNPNYKPFKILIMFTKLTTALLALFLAISAGAQSPGSLKAYYAFSGNTLDQSGQNNNGQISGNVLPATDRFGSTNCAYAFPGNANSYIEVPLSTDFSFSPAQSFTISLWYQGGTPNTGDKEDLWSEVAGNSGYYFGLFDINRLVFHECWEPMPSLPPPVDTSWHHAVAVYNNGSFDLYQDNQLMTSQSAQQVFSPISSPNTNIVIGRGFQGRIDDIRYYNEALNTAAIATLYSMPGSCQPTRVQDLEQTMVIKTYPNPASDFIHIELQEKVADWNVSLYSLQGQLIKEIKAAQSNVASIDIRDIANGLYLLKVSDGAAYQSRMIQKVQ